MSAQMRRRKPVVWGALALVWLVFAGWYTSCGGPLTREEIDGYMGLMASRGAPAERVAVIRAFLESDTGDDFVMVNAIEMNPDPGPVPGMPEGASAQQILDRYMAYMWPALLSRASHPIVFGAAAAPSLEHFGIEGAEQWSQAGLMRYRSRRDLIEIATNDAFGDAHLYKVAAMSKTFAFPIDPWAQLGDPRLFLFLVLAIAGLLLERFGLA